MSGRTLLAKIWDAHAARRLKGDRAALVIDRLLLHDITGGYALRDMLANGERPSMPRDQLFAVADHAISTSPDRGPHDSPTPGGSAMIASLDHAAHAFGFRYAEPDSLAHGIVHVVAPEQSFVLPGVTLVCGDSHTCTNGAFGALAFAAGASEIGSVLRHGALIVQRPRSLRVAISGTLTRHVHAKDVALRLLAEHGTAFARGHAIEFAGATVAAMSMAQRMTLCNMAAEMGTGYALVAPDRTTLDHVRAHAAMDPAALDEALDGWRTLRSDDDAVFDREIALDVDALAPQVTWGTSPMHALGLDGVVPDPADAADRAAADIARRSLAYMQLAPGTPMRSIAIDAAFIGSCTNARLEDLRAAAEILRGRKVAAGVDAMCTPGSMAVRAAAEAEGLDRVFESAGFAWRKSGCSNCAGREGPIWKDRRVVSSTNRNFENRQGPGTRTHLASPATVAASAVAGRLADPRHISAAFASVH